MRIIPALMMTLQILHYLTLPGSTKCILGPLPVRIPIIQTPFILANSILHIPRVLPCLEEALTPSLRTLIYNPLNLKFSNIMILLLFHIMLQHLTISQIFMFIICEATPSVLHGPNFLPFGPKKPNS